MMKLPIKAHTIIHLYGGIIRMNFIKKHGLVILSGLVVGIIAVALVAFGNPKNMGFCIACFLRDIAGGVGRRSSSMSGLRSSAWCWAPSS